jgi:hypothetical protein
MKEIIVIFSRRDRIALTLVGAGAIVFWSFVIVLTIRAFA